MRYSKVVIIVILFLGSLFCAGKKTPPEEQAYPLKAELIEGIKVITNPDFPRDGRHVLELEEELSIGVIEGDENYMLSWPYDLEVDDDGTIYVMDWREDTIKVYDKEGNYIRIVARKGRGPGEFESPAHFKISTDGKLVLLGSRHRQLDILDLTGNHLSGFKLKGYCSELKLDRENHIYYHTTSFETEDVIGAEQRIEQIKTICRADLDGQNPFVFGTFRGDKMKFKKESATTSSSGSSPHVCTTAWAVDRGGRLYAGYNEHYQMSVYDPDAQLIFKFGRQFTPLKNPNYKEGSIFSEYWPAFFRDPFFDEEGNLWLRQYGKEDEQGVKYDIFSPDGIYIRQVVVPHPIKEIKNGKIYSIVRDEEEFMFVKRFRVISDNI
ncbi:MAG: 6-bladed beta-propeller [Candidatus Aminicenantes bacterium]|nr:6-bladed beta-propeller [Candidatus Aminicenantes bacterium]